MISVVDFLQWAMIYESAMLGAGVTDPLVLASYDKALSYFSKLNNVLDSSSYRLLIYNATMHYIIVDYTPTKAEIKLNPTKWCNIIADNRMTSQVPYNPLAGSSEVTSSHSRAINTGSLDPNTASYLETKYGKTVIELTGWLSYAPILSN